MGFASTAMGATQLGLNLVGDYMSWKDQRENAKAQARALSQQANAVGKNLAYTFQNYELQRVDAFDAAENSHEGTDKRSRSGIFCTRGYQ